MIGCGVVGLQAIATAKRLGAVVKAIDIRTKRGRKRPSLKGTQIVGFEVPDELAHGEGGYARALPAEWLERERELLASLVADADIIILSALVPGEVAPMLITEQMVRSMKPGSVVVDVSIDQGGNCEVTEAGREIVIHDVFVCGRKHSRFDGRRRQLAVRPQHAAFRGEPLPQGPGTMNLDDEIVRHSLVTVDGRIVHQGTLKAMSKV